MAKIVKTELEKIKVRQTSPLQAIELAENSAQALANFKTRNNHNLDELVALHSAMDASGEFKVVEINEIAANIAEITAVKTAVDLLDL